VGLFAAFGLQLVANFQEQQIVVSPVHYTGAAIGFFLGLGYGWYQTILSFIMPRQFTSRWISIVRVIIVVIGTLSFVGVFARNMVNQNSKLPEDVLKNRTDLPTHFYRSPGDPGYAAFLVTTICEWIVGICLALFFLTLAFDLKKIKLHPPKFDLFFTVDQPKFTSDSETETDVRVQVAPVDYNPDPEDDPPVEMVQEEPQEYRLVINQRVNKIPLPGMVDMPKVDDQGESGGTSTFQSPAQRDIGERKQKGLRRSYDNAIYNGGVDELEGYIEQNSAAANGSEK